MITVERHYLSISDAAKELGISRRGVYRAAKRAEDEGHVVRDTVIGRPVILRSGLKLLRGYYYHPQDQSPEAIQRRQEWGCRGGHTPAKRGRPRDVDRFRGITIHDLEVARLFVVAVGGDIDRAAEIVKQFRRLEKSSVHGTFGTKVGAPKEA